MIGYQEYWVIMMIGRMIGRMMIGILFWACFSSHLLHMSSFRYLLGMARYNMNDWFGFPEARLP